jgi:hypothetical protein
MSKFIYISFAIILKFPLTYYIVSLNIINGYKVLDTLFLLFNLEYNENICI